MEALLKAQLQALEDLRQSAVAAPGPARRKSPSHVDMAINVLKAAHTPLHARDIIDRIQAEYGVAIGRESLVSALLRHTARGRLTKTGPNTFGLPPTEFRP
jgi:hypothetical protein